MTNKRICIQPSIFFCQGCMKVMKGQSKWITAAMFSGYYMDQRNSDSLSFQQGQSCEICLETEAKIGCWTETELHSS